MASKKTAALIAGGIVLVGLAFAGAASASDDAPPDDDDDDPGRADPDPDPASPRADPDPAEPPPPPPNPLIKDYVGSGYNWPRRDRFPNEQSFGTHMLALGYQTNPLAPNWSVISAGFMTLVRRFQRDYNKVRLTIANPGPSLSPDGLIGKNTINALLAAQQWAALGAMSWQQLVAAS